MGVEPPEQFFWFDSPLDAAGAALVLHIEQDQEFFSKYWGNLVWADRQEWERVRRLILQRAGSASWDELRQRLIPPVIEEGQRTGIQYHYLLQRLVAGVFVTISGCRTDRDSTTSSVL